MRKRAVHCHVIWLALVCAALCSCSDNPASPNGFPPTWRALRNPIPPPTYSYWFYGLWGSADGDLYLVGQHGMVLSYDGNDWAFLRHEGTTVLTDVWADSHDNLYVVGYGGTVLRYDGTGWTTMTVGTTANLYGVWGSSGTDIFAVGANGTVLHYDGDDWTSFDPGTNQSLRDVWGDGHSAFAVGDNGAILQLDSHKARAIAPVTSNSLLGIGGCWQSGFYAVGAAGTILRYDGSTWQPVRSGTIAAFSMVCGTSDGHVFVAGDNTILHFDSHEWNFIGSTSLPSLGLDGIVGVYGSSVQDMYFMGREDLIHFDGVAWNSMELPHSEPFDPPGTLLDVWAGSEGAVYAAGGPDGVLRYDGDDWTSVGGGWFNVIWGTGSTSVFTARMVVHGEGGIGDWGEDPWTMGSVFHYDGTDWTVLQQMRNVSFNGIWGESGDDVFVAGASVQFYSTGGPFITEGLRYYPRIFRDANDTWSEVFRLDTEGTVNDLWGSSDTDVYAVGSDGLIVHFDGNEWTEMTKVTSAGLQAVWGSSGRDVFAVGYGGAILHSDGTSWILMDSGTTETLSDVWGSSGDNVFVVGGNGTLLHYDGRRWQQTSSPTTNHLYGVCGKAADDVFAVGQYGTILHYGRR